MKGSKTSKVKLALGLIVICSTSLIAQGPDRPSVSQESITRDSIVQASTTLVISQVYGGGGAITGTPTYSNDYVELKNISTTSQSLSGLSLMYGSATGNFGNPSSNVFALPAVTLAPGQFYLVQVGSAGTVGAPLPTTPDATTTNLSIAATSGKVALVTAAFVANTCGATATPCTLPNAAIVDLVSYGASNNAEGGVTVNNGNALTNTQGAVRKLAGNQDTDNNNADFDVMTAPVPRNTATRLQHVVDFNGDGRTDFSIVRPLGFDIDAPLQWWVTYNGVPGSFAQPWGMASDWLTPADFDGDGKTDIAIWRSDTFAYFWILESSTNTVRGVQFGQDADDPTVIGDYDGDGKADLAVYREATTPGAQSWWYYMASKNNPNNGITFNPWGTMGDAPVPGDYDGDGKYDFVIQRKHPNGTAAIFWKNETTNGVSAVYYGLWLDDVVPGDYDGDGKTDLAVVRTVNGHLEWFYIPSSTGVISAAPAAYWGAADDWYVQGDYDGDGKTDFAIWRSSSTLGQCQFWVLKSTGGFIALAYGQEGDIPTGSFNSH